MKIATLALAVAALAAGPALAQMAATTTAKPAAAKTTTTKTVATKKTTTKPMGANMATHTTKTGKTITYDCSKKGNMNKTACKTKK